MRKYENPKHICFLDCQVNRFPDKIGGNMPGVHYIRDVADADGLIASLVSSFICSLI